MDRPDPVWISPSDPFSVVRCPLSVVREESEQFAIFTDNGQRTTDNRLSVCAREDGDLGGLSAGEEADALALRRVGREAANGRLGLLLDAILVLAGPVPVHPQEAALLV